jgi:hypothetical protein
VLILVDIFFHLEDHMNRVFMSSKIDLFRHFHKYQHATMPFYLHFVLIVVEVLEEPIPAIKRKEISIMIISY